MKFRYKVLMVNLIALSLSLGVVGYLMIRRNFELGRDTQVKNAIMENNLVQSSVEYELLQLMNTAGGRDEVISGLKKIGERVVGGMLADSSSVYVRHGDDYVYSSDKKEAFIDDSLYSDLNIGGKNYMICKEDGQYFIYVTSYSKALGSNLYIVSKQEISDVYRMLEEQTRYFRMLIAGVILAVSVIMYFVSVYLTRPLEKLNRVTGEITAGNYDVHVSVTGGDEVGQLAGNVNIMADAVLKHVEELKEMIQSREQFVADFTHEIKTPMTTIIGYSDMLRSMELSREEQILAANYIFSEGKRLEVMSGKLFELLYLKRHDLKMGPVHVDDLERELRRITEPMLEHKRIELRMDIEPAVLEGDKDLLVTVFVNLIDNARKASKEGSAVGLVGRKLRKDAYYELRVVDRGIGMSQEDVKHICDEFYMVDKSRSRKEGGAGLGLSLSALILERHRAVLHVESSLGEGTTMRVVFYENEKMVSEDEEISE